MSEWHENAKKTAYLVEYLIHEARTKHEAQRFHIAMATGQRILFKFDAGAKATTASLPANPPDKYRPEYWERANARLIEHSRGADIIWEWPTPYAFAADDAELYIRELLTFARGEITVEQSNGLRNAIQTQDPEELGATGLRREVAEGISALLIEEWTPAQLSWHDNQWS